MKVIYEDKDLIVIDKPAGQVVEPGAGEEDNSVISEILKKYPQLKNEAWPTESVDKKQKKRIGVVHRLDKDTSGLLVIAKNPQAQKNLMEQWQNRKVTKEYLALVLGELPKKGRIELPVGRAPIHRQKMAAIAGGREAVTEFEVIKIVEVTPQREKIIPQQERPMKVSLVNVKTLTGRTHQIRVHFSKIGHPILGDQVYCTKISKKLSQALGLRRQFLHATLLKFRHPQSQQILTFASPLPPELKAVDLFKTKL